MADEEKTKKAAKQEPASSPTEQKPEEITTEGGASTDTSPSPGQVTLTQQQMERLRRKLKAKYH